MADAADMAQPLEEEHLARSLAAARAPVPAGEPGECESCGNDSPRLVRGRCARCRDEARRRAKLGGER